MNKRQETIAKLEADKQRSALNERSLQVFTVSSIPQKPVCFFKPLRGIPDSS